MAAQERAERAAAKHAELLAAQEDLRHRLELHLEEFTPITKPVIPVPARLTPVEVQREVERWRRHAKEQAKSLPRAQRGAYVEASRAAALDHLEREYQESCRQAAAASADVERWWSALQQGEPTTVLATVNQALSDNEQPSAAVAYTQGEASVVIMAPSLDYFPTHAPGLTAAGNPTLKRLTQTDRHSLYFQSVLSHMVVTLKEVFAVAPTVTRCRAVMLGHSESGLGVLVAGVYARTSLATVDWNRMRLLDVVLSADDLRYHRAGRTGDLRPLDLTDDPDLRDLISSLGRESTDESPDASEDAVQIVEQAPTTQHSDAVVPPAGWYPEPGDPRWVRYWDGAQWTTHLSPSHTLGEAGPR